MLLSTAIPKKGTYTLIIHLSKAVSAKIGQQGVKVFPRGYYTYTGSAFGLGTSSLKHRVSRHLKKTGKKKRWHIDFLLAHKEVSVTAAIIGETARKIECEINRYIKEQGAARTPVLGFGASDCKLDCQSHLLYFGEKEIKEDIAAFYADKLASGPVVVELGDTNASSAQKSQIYLGETA